MTRSCPWELLGLPQLKSAKPTRCNIAYRNSMSSEGAMKCVVADINSGPPSPLLLPIHFATPPGISSSLHLSLAGAACEGTSTLLYRPQKLALHSMLILAHNQNPKTSFVCQFPLSEVSKSCPRSNVTNTISTACIWVSVMRVQSGEESKRGCSLLSRLRHGW